jgi:glycerol-3-phosphate acyltransferase PlsX
MRIGIDMMGGDYAPYETSLGVIEAYKEIGAQSKFVLIGDKEQILAVFNEHGFNPANIEFVHTAEVIGMAENPTKAISQKPNSSLATGFSLLKQGKIDSFASAGNTGAMLVGSMLTIKPVAEIMRPAIATIVPKLKGGIGILLDVGVNADCKPEMLQQFAVLGSLLAEHVYHIKNPKVALINIGEEDEKGNMLSQAAHPLLKATREINFIGNVEGRDLFNDRADVIVCDGFTGNIMLKLAESFYGIIKERNIHDTYLDRFNYEDYGGTPVLGIKSNVIIAHGISKSKAIKNMIILSRDVAEVNLCEKISQALHVSVTG